MLWLTQQLVIALCLAYSCLLGQSLVHPVRLALGSMMFKLFRHLGDVKTARPTHAQDRHPASRLWVTLANWCPPLDPSAADLDSIWVYVWKITSKPQVIW